MENEGLFSSGIRVGARAIGEAASKAAIERNLAAFIGMNERASRERVMAKEAARKAMAPYLGAFESLFRQQGLAVPAKIRAPLALDHRSDLAHIERSRGPQSVLMLPLDRHVNVYGPPYDYSWSGGNPFEKDTDLAGTFHVGAVSEQTGAAAAGLGLLLTTDKPAFVAIRAHVPTMWVGRTRTTGFFSSATVRGGIDASAWVDGALCTPVRRDRAFSVSTGGFDDDGFGDGLGLAWGDNISLEFMMSPGKTYAVSYGAWVEFDTSSGLGDVTGVGHMYGGLQFVVVTRYVAG